MKFKATISVLTLLLLLVSVVTVAQDAKQEAAEQKQVKSQSEAADSTEIKEPVAQAQAQVIAYYFHGTRRCTKCKKIEAYTREALETAFADQLADASIVWRPINTDEDGNQHFTKDYQLFTRSVILSQVKGDQEIKWKNLDKVWHMLGSKDEFVEYVRTEMDAFMSED